MPREAEVQLAKGLKVKTVCRHLGIIEQTYYRLRKAVSDLALDKLILKETLEGNY